MLKQWKKAAVSLCLMGFIGVQGVYAQQLSEVGALIGVLEKKGFLTQGEAAQVLKETKEVIKAREKQIDEKVSGDSSTPKWVKNFKLKGDIRVRYQWTDREGKDERNRGRIRYRLGIETKVNDKLKVSARLSSGGDDPRSTNQSFDESFSTKDIRLDQAYLEYTPTEYAKIRAGKFGKSFYAPANLMWDGDLSFEGGAIMIEKKLDDKFTWFANGGFYVLDEESSEKDPTMIMIQPGFKWDINEVLQWQMGIGYLGFQNLDGATLPHASGTNTTDAGGAVKYDYDSFFLGTELAFKYDDMPRMALVAEYVKANSSDQDTGYLIGFKLGDKKVSKKGQWQLFYNYRRLEADAVLDIFPDSDFYDGETGVKGSQLSYQYGLLDNVTLGLTYFNTVNLDGDEKREQLIQTDVQVKF